uniref:Ig-like domain-containing protein n=1 Tax=Labrus bergylta TaxID=56723 RepID=A0A3Q3DZY6_9LABR
YDTQLTYQESSVSIHQERRFVSAEVGHTVSLQCFYEGGDSACLYWYKQSLGQTPRLISTFYVYDKRITFHDEFSDESRFKLHTENKTIHLTILNLKVSDSATYYCACSYKYVFNFTEGTIVSVKDSGWNVLALVHQSASETTKHGDAVTLSCTVLTGTCDGEHSVYWFRNSEESHSGLIYTQGDRNNSNDQCEKNTKTDSCVYNLPMKNLNLSDAGTYYCAVASCGRILFGNGTKLDFEMYFLTGALTATTILVVALAFSIYKKIKGNICQCRESQPELSAPSTGDDEGNLHYAALSVHQPERSRRQRHIETGDCVYSGVKR